MGFVSFLDVPQTSFHARKVESYEEVGQKCLLGRVLLKKHESPSRLDSLSFPNSRQCNVTIKIFQRVRANKYEPFNRSIETLDDVVCDTSYQTLDSIISFDCPFLPFLFSPLPTRFENRDDKRISSFETSKQSTKRFDFLMQLFPSVLFWLIIFYKLSAQSLTDLNRLRQTGCANVSWICVTLAYDDGQQIARH